MSAWKAAKSTDIKVKIKILKQNSDTCQLFRCLDWSKNKVWWTCNRILWKKLNGLRDLGKVTPCMDFVKKKLEINISL